MTPLNEYRPARNKQRRMTIDDYGNASDRGCDIFSRRHDAQEFGSRHHRVVFCDYDEIAYDGMQFRRIPPPSGIRDEISRPALVGEDVFPGPSAAFLSIERANILP
jgi:isocitrate dehydrogenase kinase/phosphatase